MLRKQKKWSLHSFVTVFNILDVYVLYPVCLFPFIYYHKKYNIHFSTNFISVSVSVVTFPCLALSETRKNALLGIIMTCLLCGCCVDCILLGVNTLECRYRTFITFFAPFFVSKADSSSKEKVKKTESISEENYGKVKFNQPKTVLLFH